MNIFHFQNKYDTTTKTTENNNNCIIMWVEVKKKSDSDFLSYNLMLNCGKKFRASRDKKYKYSSSCVVRKNISE
jgi:hypothetical protein